MTWAEVDAWASRAHADGVRKLQRVRMTDPGWRAFAELADGRLRFFAHPDDPRIVCRRPCSHVPGRWRAWRKALRHEVPEVLPLVDGDPDDLVPERLPAEWWRQVLVALDEWLDGGCQVMRAPTKVPR